MGAFGQYNARMPLLRVLTLAIAFVLLATACGSAEVEVGSLPDETEAEPEAPAIDINSKPEITIPGEEPPAALTTEDLVVGDGAEAVLGSQVEVDYVGVSYSTGEEFDASWGRGPFIFALGAGQVISGWDQGVEGMKVGGRRQLTIPPDFAYGAGGIPGVIAENETLVFVVDLRAVN